MSARIEPLSMAHLEAISLRPDHAAYVEALGGWNDAIQANLVRSGGIAMVASEGVVACAGVCMIWAGTGQLWMRVSGLSAVYPHVLARQSRKFVREAWDLLGLRRMQATVLQSNGAAMRFIQWLGLEAEGVLRSYGPEGGDYIMFAKVRG